MADFKKILLHIFFSQTHFPEIKKLGKEDKDLENFYPKALEYACGGNPKSNKEQKPLQSIFDSLAGNTAQGYYFEPKTLSIENFNFPTKKAINSNYDAFSKFAEEHKHIANFEGRAYADTCLALLEKHFSYTPCGYEGLEDVSLYDHIKSVMGLMVSLQGSKDENTEKPILLIGGDISGIQGFIYDIISTYASKNLKGRSFYLQLLVDSVIEKLLDNLGLCNANIVYASGGGFYFLAPNTENTQGTLKKQIKDISEAIYKTHKTALHLAISSVEVQKDTFMNNLYQNNELVWDTLIRQINAIHKRKFVGLEDTKDFKGFDSFFKAHEEGGLQERDAITNEELELDSDKPIFEITEEGIDPVSKNAVLKNTDRARKFIAEPTKQQIDLGKDLREFDFLLCSKEPISFIQRADANNYNYNICDLGFYYCFVTLEGFTDTKFTNNFTIKIINFKQADKIRMLAPHTYNFSFYGGNDYPTIKVKNKKGDEFDTSKTFSELAGQKDEEENRKYVNKFEEPQLKRLGILRMDVDGLGAIFGEKGFKGQKKRTFSKYATLSRNLDLFFKGYLNSIWKNNTPFKENSQIIYAGGDDLFIVGRWDILIDFAECIQKNFNTWICENTKLGLSGGMAIVAPKYPIAKAAEQSDSLENSAKKHTYMHIEKNAFNFLGLPLNWEFEYKLVKRLKGELLYFVDKSENRSILMRIQTFAAQRAQQEKNDTTQSWRWLLAYDFARFRERIKKKEDTDIAELRLFIDKIKAAIFIGKYENINSNHDFLKLLSLAARWAELWERTNKK